MADYTTLSTNFGSTGVVYAQGDLNYDGIVNGADFAIMSNKWTIHRGRESLTGMAGHELVPRVRYHRICWTVAY